MSSHWSATFPLEPVAYGRPRVCTVAGRAQMYKPAKTRKAMADLKLFIANANPEMFDGPICVALEFTFARPKSVSAKKRPHPCIKPDLSNVIKTVEDAGTGLLWKDDAQIVTLLARKRYGEKASIRITVWLKDRGMRIAGRCG